MNKPCALAFVEDQFLRSQFVEAGKSTGVDFYFASQGEQLSQLAKTLAPFLVILDLTGLDTGWLFKHISMIKNSRPKLSIVGYVFIDQEDVRERASHYGCTAVVLKGEIFRKLPDIIESAIRSI